MKYLILIFLVFASANVLAQDSEKIAVQKTIEAFFDGFHKQDSVSIKKTVSDKIIMQTIASDEAGRPLLKKVGFDDFIARIVSMPETTKFEEIIKDYSIQIDGPMANAWTAYDFMIDDAIHHCGVNSFQLLKRNGDWKIIYIIDTRRKEGCE